MANGIQTYDAIVIGAGFSGMYMIKALRDKLGLKVRAYEAGETVGGTWYWNRYPGARCHSDSYIYCFTWDKQLLQEWEWSAEASAEWCDAHPNSYPPTILHVTDGQSTDGACASSRRGGRCCPGSPVPCALRVLRDGERPERTALDRAKARKLLSQRPRGPATRLNCLSSALALR